MSKTPERYQDPLGDYMRAAQTTQQQHLQSFPNVQDVYQGFYIPFTAYGKEGANCLNGSGGITGTPLDLVKVGQGLGLFSQNDICVAILDKSTSDELGVLLGSGWTIHIRLACVIFEAEKKEFSAQGACLCYGPDLLPEYQQALETFITNIVDRIGGGSKPRLRLTQDQFVKVLESGGGWFLTKDEPWPKLPQGSIYFRRRKTVNDRLIGAALKGNKGCVVLSWVATAVIILVIAFAVWFFFIR